MKASDLMIGDWMQDITPCVIDAVSNEDICTYRNEIGYVTANPSNLKPIPLTAEILERNGFKYDGSGQMSMMFLSKPQFSEGIRFNIYVGLKKKTIEVFAAHPIEKSPNWRKSNKVFLEVCGCYVHELQHALRLCGIDKDIEL